MKYFRAEEDPVATRLPNTFVQGFLEVCRTVLDLAITRTALMSFRVVTEHCFFGVFMQ